MEQFTNEELEAMINRYACGILLGGRGVETKRKRMRDIQKILDERRGNVCIGDERDV